MHIEVATVGTVEPLGGAHCFDATLASPFTRDGDPRPGAATQDAHSRLPAQARQALPAGRASAKAAWARRWSSFNSAEVGKTAKARAAYGPACDTSSDKDAASL